MMPVPMRAYNTVRNTSARMNNTSNPPATGSRISLIVAARPTATSLAARLPTFQFRRVTDQENVIVGQRAIDSVRRHQCIGHFVKILRGQHTTYLPEVIAIFIFSFYDAGLEFFHS